MNAIDSTVEPTAAERVRSLLAAARSLTLSTDGHQVELIGLHTLEASGHLLLNVPAESHLGGELALAPYGVLEATVEFTDVAPVSVPDRVRARVLLRGRLGHAGEGACAAALRFEPDAVTLECGGRLRSVTPAEVAAAEPDPLAETEAEMLIHLAAAHEGTIELLAQLVEPRLLIGVTRVDPVRLDRYGVVLRLRRAGDHRDVRLLFPSPLRNPAHAVVQTQALLARARSCPRRRHPHSRT